MYSPSSGSVFAKDYNIFENMDRFRNSLGLCPQHDLLFPYLTAIEHLIFFGMVSVFGNRKSINKRWRSWVCAVSSVSPLLVAVVKGLRRVRGVGKLFLEFNGLLGVFSFVNRSQKVLFTLKSINNKANYFNTKKFLTQKIKSFV